MRHYIKENFRIKDLENFSGVKAHTIRIWEKRYNLLSPERTDTNIRYYSHESLQKLLNITLLYNNNFKISKIAKLSEQEMKETCMGLISANQVKSRILNNFKIAMMQFDTVLFEKTYQEILQKTSFKDVFVNYFIPFLNEIGLLWQIDSINPSHEHFITALIKQKIQVQLEQNQMNEIKKDETFVLFLPDHEIHDLGMLYLNYELLCAGYRVINLGQCLPISSLELFRDNEHKTMFIAYCTVAPSMEDIDDYTEELYNKIIKESNSELWILGNNTIGIDKMKSVPSISIFKSVTEVLEKIHAA
jgi:DNA-binding transcriptional MerR regulator